MRKRYETSNQRIERKLDDVLSLLKMTIIGERIIMSKLSDALDFAEQTASEDAAADNSAKELLVSLSKMVADLKQGVEDPAVVARIDALANGIRERASSLAAAVVENTPSADPEPTPEPEPVPEPEDEPEDETA